MQRRRVVIDFVIFPTVAQIARPIVEDRETISYEDAESAGGLAIVLVNLW
jgi:hypothetical protein